MGPGLSPGRRLERDTAGGRTQGSTLSCRRNRRRPMLRFLSIVLALLGLPIASAAAQDARGSECLAMANAAPRAVPVALRRTAAGADEVAITYAGHSTYIIDTPGGLRIATDYNGAYRTGR